MQKSDLLQVMKKLGIDPQGENARTQFVNAHCPLAPWTHQNGTDSSASFAIRWDDSQRSHFTCLACKHKGPLTRLVRHLGRMRQKDYQELIAQIDLIEVNAGISGALTTSFDRPLDDDLAMPGPVPLNEAIYDGLYPSAWEVPQGREYLLRRGVGEQTSAELNLMFRAAIFREGKRPWIRNDVLFPVRNRNQHLFGFSGRTTLPDCEPKVYDEDLPKRHLILGENRWADGKPVLLVEGLMGYARLVEIGAETLFNVGAVMGSIMTPEKATILRDWGLPVFLLFDNDPAGDAGIFGRIKTDPQTKQPEVDRAGNVLRESESSALHQLVHALSVYVPAWPTYEDGRAKADPDELTLDELEVMIQATLPVPAPALDSPTHFPLTKTPSHGRMFL